MTETQSRITEFILTDQRHNGSPRRPHHRRAPRSRLRSRAVPKPSTPPRLSSSRAIQGPLPPPPWQEKRRGTGRCHMLEGTAPGAALMPGRLRHEPERRVRRSSAGGVPSRRRDPRRGPHLRAPLRRPLVHAAAWLRMLFLRHWYRRICPPLGANDGVVTSSTAHTSFPWWRIQQLRMVRYCYFRDYLVPMIVTCEWWVYEFRSIFLLA
jgi:hypothetical protein